MSTRPTRLGVEAAVVAGARVPGDVALRGGAVDAVGLQRGEGARGVAVPGFVDWQVNGFGGVHFTDAEPPDYLRAGAALAAEGVVWVAPTILNTSPEGYTGALGVLTEVRREQTDTGFLGAHLEGPNLAAAFHGAHDARNFADGESARIPELLRAGPVSMVTLAPERPGVMELIGTWTAAGATVSIGHSDAAATVCATAMGQGASAITHCWNAHRRLTARDPGPAGWALSNDGVTVGLIADGIHVAPEVLALTFAAAPGRVALTTDAVAHAGTTATEPRGGPGHVTVADGVARLADGTLAGSVATPTQMIRVLERAGVPFEDCLHALSVPQAAALGLTENHLRPGDPADVTVLDDDHAALQTWRRGTRVF